MLGLVNLSYNVESLVTCSLLCPGTRWVPGWPSHTSPSALCTHWATGPPGPSCHGAWHSSPGWAPHTGSSTSRSATLSTETSLCMSLLKAERKSLHSKIDLYYLYSWSLNMSHKFYFLFIMRRCLNIWWDLAWLSLRVFPLDTDIFVYLPPLTLLHDTSECNDSDESLSDIFQKKKLNLYIYNSTELQDLKRQIEYWKFDRKKTTKNKTNILLLSCIFIFYT